MALLFWAILELDPLLECVPRVTSHCLPPSLRLVTTPPHPPGSTPLPSRAAAASYPLESDYHRVTPAPISHSQVQFLVRVVTSGTQNLNYQNDCALDTTAQAVSHSPGSSGLLDPKLVAPPSTSAHIAPIPRHSKTLLTCVAVNFWG